MTQDSHDERRRKHMAVMDDKEKRTKAMTEQVKDAIASLKHLVECRCDEAYTGRSRHDPYSACDYADEVKIVSDHIREIGAQLKMVLEREAETQVRHNSKMDALEAKLADALDDAQKADAHATGLEADRRNTYIALHLITRLHSEVEAKLGQAEMLLYDAMVQLEDGKIKTRRNRARLIREFLDEIRGEPK